MLWLCFTDQSLFLVPVFPLLVPAPSWGKVISQLFPLFQLLTFTICSLPRRVVDKLVSAVRIAQFILCSIKVFSENHLKKFSKRIIAPRGHSYLKLLLLLQNSSKTFYKERIQPRSTQGSSSDKSNHFLWTFIFSCLSASFGGQIVHHCFFL